MFSGCKLLIVQKRPGGPQDTWVEVTLRKARVGGLPFYDVVVAHASSPGEEDSHMGRFIDRTVDGWLWWGRWTAGDNSVTNDVNQDHSVGTAHNDARYWRYNVYRQELQLMQRGLESGARDESGGAAYKVTYSTALELDGANITARGIIPHNRDQGNGWVNISSRALNTGRIHWEKATS